MLGVCCVVAWAIGVWVVMLLWTPWGGILMLSGIGVPWRMVTSTGRKEFRKALSDACSQPPFFAVILLISLMGVSIPAQALGETMDKGSNLAGRAVDCEL